MDIPEKPKEEIKEAAKAGLEAAKQGAEAAKKGFIAGAEIVGAKVGDGVKAGAKKIEEMQKKKDDQDMSPQ